MLKDKHGESVFDYAVRFASVSFRKEIDRKLLQHFISQGKTNFTFVEAQQLPLLLEELAFKFINHVRVMYSVVYIVFLVYYSFRVNMITISFGLVSLLLQWIMFILREESLRASKVDLETLKTNKATCFICMTSKLGT